MSRRKDMSPQRRPFRSKPAQSQPGTPKDYHTTMASTSNNNENSSLRLQNMHKMQLELHRLASFSEYQQDPGGLSCLTLARKGYFYDGRLIACFRCHVPLPREENITAENLDEVHRRTSLNCSPLETVNVPLTQPRSPVTESNGSLPEEPISAVYRRAWARAESRGIFTSGSQTGRENLDQGQFPGRENLGQGWFPGRENLDQGQCPGRENLNEGVRFRDEAARLRSFRGWPQGAPVQPEDLAAAGFYYTGTGDRVCCAFCEGVLRGWKRGVDPTTEHDRHYGDRNCPFRRHQRRDRHDRHCHDYAPEVYCNDQLRSSLPMTTTPRERTVAWSEQTTVNRNESPFLKLNLLINEQSRQVPKHPEFADQLQRSRTYPLAAFQTGQRAESLARAGDFYEEKNMSINRAHMSTLTEVGNTAHENASHFAKEDYTLPHSAHRPDIFIRSAISTIPSPVEFGTQREHADHHGITSPESDKSGARRKLTTSPGTIISDYQEFIKQRRHTTRPGTNSPESEKFGTHRKHTITHDTARSAKFLRFWASGASPKSKEFGTQREHTNPQGTTIPETAEFGTQRKHTTKPGTNRIANVDFGCSRNSTNLHVTNTPASMEFDTQRNHACTKRNTGNTTSTKVDITATDANSNISNPLASASAGVSLEVAEENDDSIAKKTDGQQKKVGKECSSSNAADDDPEWREFFMCQICFSDSIRCWLAIPCRHMLCRVCKQKMLICPFCRVPIQKYQQIRYRCQK